jgi:hypothetical protein
MKSSGKEKERKTEKGKKEKKITGPLLLNPAQLAFILPIARTRALASWLADLVGPLPSLSVSTDAWVRGTSCAIFLLRNGRADLSRRRQPPRVNHGSVDRAHSRRIKGFFGIFSAHLSTSRSSAVVQAG